MSVCTAGAPTRPGGRKRRVDKEQFFTSEPVVRRCFEAIERLYGRNRFAWHVEPSAGDGAFLDGLPAGRFSAVDIAPMADGIERADFLAWSPPRATGPVLTIGNPPFGPRGVLAVKFLAKACSYSDVVAFVLPRSFNKDTFQSRVDRRFHLVHAFDCDDFRTPVGAPLRVRAVFQVWERREVPRPLETRPRTHPDFEMKHFHLSRVAPGVMAAARRSYDFALPQVGTFFRPRDTAGVVAGSHFFVKALRPGVRAVFERLDFAFLAGKNTTITSLSRSDVVQAYTDAVARAG